MGIYVFKVRSLVEALHRHCYAGSGFDFGFHVIPSLVDSRRVYAYEFCDEETGAPRYWRDVGTIDSYYNTSMDMLRTQPLFDLWSNTLPRDAALGRPSIDPGTRVSHTMLCDGAEVAQGAEIEDCVLMPGSAVDRGARLRRVIVDEGVQIPAGFAAGWDMEADRQDHIVSPGGVVVISHAPRGAHIVPEREQVSAPFRRKTNAPVRSRREGA